MKLMTKNIKAILTAAALCVVVACGQTALAQRPGGGGPPQDGGGFIERLAKILDLTDAQLAQIKTIREQAAAASKPHQERLTPLLEQAQALIEADTFNETALRNLSAQMQPIQLELHIIQARAQSASYNLLTAEQKAKLVEIRKMMENGGGRHGGGRPVGGGRPGGPGRP